MQELTIQQLREKRNEIARGLRNTVDLKGQNVQWTPEEMANYQRGIEAIDEVDASIKRIQDLLDRETERARPDNRRADREGISVDHATHKNHIEKELFRAWLAYGSKALENLTEEGQRAFADMRAAQARVWEEQNAAQRGASNAPLVMRPQNALAVGTNSAGGYLVPTEFMAELQQRLKAWGGVRQVCNILTIGHGRPIQIPTTDATTEIGERIAENTTATALDATFGQVTLNAYKYSSKSVPVSFELLQDSAIDIQEHLLQRLTVRIGRAQSVDFTTGTGSSQPQGVVTGAGTFTAAAAAAIAYNDLVGLYHSVDPAYRQSGQCRWMMNDAVLAVVRKITDSYGHPLWQPDIGMDLPATLLGKPYSINQHMASTVATTNKTMLFGDFSQYTVRDSMDLQLFRFDDSAYVLLGQIGFLAWTRADGRYVANTSTDVVKALLQP